MRPFALLIDDEENFRNSIASAFELRGIPLDVAPDWETGLALFQACAHELVIADYNLPNSKNGLLLLTEAKAHRPASKLILISGVLSDTATEILQSSSLVDAYLPKRPDIADQLLEAAQEAAQRAVEPTDWTRVADAYLASAELDRKEIERIDEALRLEMGG
jgi:ActR/RegA family two-component response regulator